MVLHILRRPASQTRVTDPPKRKMRERDPVGSRVSQVVACPHPRTSAGGPHKPVVASRAHDGGYYSDLNPRSRLPWDPSRRANARFAIPGWRRWLAGGTAQTEVCGTQLLSSNMPTSWRRLSSLRQTLQPRSAGFPARSAAGFQPAPAAPRPSVSSTVPISSIRNPIRSSSSHPSS